MTNNRISWKQSNLIYNTFNSALLLAYVHYIDVVQVDTEKSWLRDFYVLIQIEFGRGYYGIAIDKTWHMVIIVFSFEQIFQVKSIQHKYLAYFSEKKNLSVVVVYFPEIKKNQIYIKVSKHNTFCFVPSEAFTKIYIPIKWVNSSKHQTNISFWSIANKSMIYRAQ